MNCCSDISLIRITVLVFIILFIFGLLTYSELIKFSHSADGGTLVLVHVIFRNGKSVVHGKRNIFTEEIPCASCELLKEGQEAMFQLGLELRKKYSYFIDKDFMNATFEANHGDTKLSKKSLMFLVAGLSPSKVRRYKWSTDQSLQRITLTTINSSDPLLSFKPKFCAKWDRLYNKMSHSEIYSILLKENAKYYEYIFNRTLKNGDPLTPFLINYNIESGVKPPKWINEIYPQPTKILVDEYFKLLTANDEMKQIVGGTLLSKIINDTNEKISTTSTSNTKIHLYSVEDYNLQYLLRTIGVNAVEQTGLGSHAIIEVHLFEGNYFLKFYFNESVDDKTEIIDLPYCGKLCPFHYFVERNKYFLGTSNICDT